MLAAYSQSCTDGGVSKAHEAIQEAVELLQRVDQILANVPDASDEVARTQLEIGIMSCTSRERERGKQMSDLKIDKGIPVPGKQVDSAC